MRRLYTFVFGFSILIALGLIFAVFSFQVTSHPKFCGSCHVMRPYYESWKTSSHYGIPCVDCHIPPGITSEFRKKYEALAMVARYFTGTYSTNPWAEVEDAACLRCHEKRLLSGKVIFKNVLFDHTPHLTQLRRGKKLRCTSCHSQIVQGTHIKVTETTCFLCHFKDTKLGEGTARCNICHEVPKKEVKLAGFSFNHADVVKYDMDCLMCHAHSVEGEGNVPKERCYTCHNDPRRVKEYDKTEMMHRIHVTDHKVECMNCHQEIYHGPPKEIEEVVKTPCSSCHLQGHSPQKDLYMGIGGKGVEPTPSVMFLAGIRCEGCHIMGRDGKVKRSGPFSCMNCHGASYFKIYNEWKESIKRKIKETEAVLNNVRSKIGNTELFRNAMYNLNLVKNGVGIHNVIYSEKLLLKSIEFVNEALKKKGYTPIKTEPLFITKAYIECTRCHYGIERKEIRFYNIIFPHYPHILKGIFCNKCHVKNKDKKPHMKVIFKTSVECAPCHHGKSIGKKCISCHKNVFKIEVIFENKKFSHQIHVKEMELSCDNCHDKNVSLKRDFCSECH